MVKYFKVYSSDLCICLVSFSFLALKKRYPTYTVRYCDVLRVNIVTTFDIFFSDELIVASD